MKKDRRIKKSKTALKKSLLELMKIKTIPHISIKEICIKANLNRSTFYANYHNIEELLLEIYYDIYEDMLLSLNKNNHENELDQDIYALKNIIDYFYDHQELLHLIFKNNQQHLFEKHLTTFYAQKFVKDNYDYVEKYTFLYHSFGSFTLISQWIIDQYPCSSLELAKLIYSISHV